MKLSVKKEVQVEAKTLKIHIKVSDNFSASIVDQDGDTIWDQDDGYVPDFMPGEHYGDYVILDIDLDSGQVINWQKPTSAALEKLINASFE